MKNILYIVCCFLLTASCSKSSDTNLNSVAPGSGQGGSLARFTISQSHLYVVDNRKLYTYSLANVQKPQLVNEKEIGMDVETIYPFKDKLFVGSQNAMYIYSLENPDKPDYIGTASHVRACDPVVADNDVAYVTVRSGSTCGGTLNALIVYNIQNESYPYEVARRDMNNPWGLGIRSNRLYVCDGNSGLSIYNITNLQNPQLVKKITGESFFDVIATDNLLVCMIDGGTALYEYGSDDELVQVAKIID